MIEHAVTVEELIKILQTFDEDFLVYVNRQKLTKDGISQIETGYVDLDTY